MDNLILMVIRRKNNQLKKIFKQILLKNNKKKKNNQYGIDFFKGMNLKAQIMNLDKDLTTMNKLKIPLIWNK